MSHHSFSTEEIINSENAQKRPGLLLGLLEGRALLEIGAYFATQPMHKLYPSGDGHPVMVIPGFGAGDGATFLLRRFLKRLGYQTYAWREGINVGRKKGLFHRLQGRIEKLSNRHGQKVSLVGWSLGGVMSRQLAFRNTDHLRSVITLGSPLYGDRYSTNISTILEVTNKIRGVEVITKPLGNAPWVDEPAVPIPFSSLYSRTDGIVSWQTCLEPNYPLRENIHIPCSHLGFSVNPLSLYVIADRLALPEDEFQPFSPGPLLQTILRNT